VPLPSFVSSACTDADLAAGHSSGNIVDTSPLGCNLELTQFGGHFGVSAPDGVCCGAIGGYH